MIVSGWHVDGFGTLVDQHREGLGPGACIVFGPNEAGKSTLLAFLRFILFGASGARPAPALRGGWTGGRVFLRDEQGATWTAERFGDGRSLTLLGPDGQPSSADALARLLGGADAALFSSVFAFSLSELSRLDSLSEGSVRDRILSAGITGAGSTASQARRALEAALAALLRPRSGQARINRLMQELRRAQAALTDAQQQTASYERLAAEEAAAAAAVEALAAEMAELARDDRVLETLLGLWEPWNRWRTATERLAALPERAAPADGRRRMADVRGRDAAAQERVRGLAEQVEGLARERGELQAALRPALEAVAERVRAVAAGLAAQRAALDGLARWRERHEDLRLRLSERLAALGPGWDEDRLRGFDLSVPVGDQCKGWTQRLAEAEGRATRAREAADQLAGELSRSRREVDEAEAGVAAAAELPSRQDVEARREQFESLERRLPWLRAVPARLAALVGLSVGVAAYGAHEAGVAGWVTALAGAAALVTILGTLGAGWAAERRSIREAAAGLGLPPVPSPRTLDALRTRLRRDDEAARQRSEAEERLKDSGAAVLRLGARQEDAAAAAAAESGRVDALRREWDLWAHDRGFPEGLSPAGVASFADAVGVAREVAGDAESAAAEGLLRAEQVAAWRDEADQALRSAGRTPAGDDGTLAAQVEGLAAEVEAALDRRRQVDERSHRLAELEPQMDEARRDAERVRQERAALLAEAGAEDDPAYDRALDEAEARHEAGREVHARWSAIAAQLGDGAYARDLQDRLGTGDPAAWLSRRSAVQERLSRAREEHEASIAARSEAERRRQELEASADVAAASSRVEGVRAELAEAVHEWRRLRLSVHLVDATLAGFIRDRQPEVLSIASQAFTAVTSGRYVRVVQDPLAAESLAVVDRAGARLQPPQLSRGTAEQLYLSLRLGLAESFARRAAALPLVLDDVLVNFDPARAGAMLHAFAGYVGAPGRQVLLFTCHPETRDLALRTCGPCPIIVLAPTDPVGTALASAEAGAAEAAATRPVAGPGAASPWAGAVWNGGLPTAQAGTGSADGSPAGTEPAETGSADGSPAGTEPAETGPVGAAPAGGDPVGAARADGDPADVDLGDGHLANGFPAGWSPTGAERADGIRSGPAPANGNPAGAEGEAGIRASEETARGRSGHLEGRPGRGRIRGRADGSAAAAAAAAAAALVLERFAGQGPVTPRDLRAAFGWDGAAVSRVLRSLMSRGLARREGSGRASRYLVG